MAPKQPKRASSSAAAAGAPAPKVPKPAASQNPAVSQGGVAGPPASPNADFYMKINSMMQELEEQCPAFTGAL
jgi:hypothetical protein